MRNKKTIPIISAIEAKKLLRNEGYGFLAYLINKPKDIIRIEEVPVVNEFLEVFPKELTSLPPDREIEFVIETLPGTTPISKTPCRMAPAELRELKAQLQDLIEGFIRISSSPWGAIVFALAKWRHYLYGTTFEVYTDHKRLKY